MKVNLVVASGPHAGKQIPVVKQEFLIGRDPTCQLRPASQAISKQHCGILVREKNVFLKDYGSTNGTFLNDKQLEANAEVQLKPGDQVRVGPLEFKIEIILPRPSDSTPLPDGLAQSDSSATAKLQAAAGVAKGTPPAPKKEPIPATPKASTSDSSDDDMAAMLLGMDEEHGVPEGSTVFEMAAVNPDGTPKKEEKKDDKKPMTPESSSAAASEILRKFMKRPR